MHPFQGDFFYHTHHQECGKRNFHPPTPQQHTAPLPTPSPKIAFRMIFLNWKQQVCAKKHGSVHLGAAAAAAAAHIYLEDLGEEAHADLLLVEVVEAVEGGDGMLEGLTGAAGPQAVAARLRGLRQLVVRTVELLVVAVGGVAGGVVDTGIFRGGSVIALAVR